MKFTPEQKRHAIDLLNKHSQHVEMHWQDTLYEIGGYGTLTDKEVQELLNDPDVRDGWNI